MPDTLPATETAPLWHALPAEEVMTRLAVGPDGITDQESALRLARYGPNVLPEPRRTPAWRRFLAQFENVLIQVLLAAAAVTAILGHWVDTAVIVAVCLINALVGFIQEGRAEAAMEAVRRMLSPRASVIRDGKRLSVDAADIVPGDIVLLEPGDRVPADLRLVAARGLAIQEAILTGESVPVAKSVEPVAETAPLGDRTSMAFSGTVVAAGIGKGVVVATGAMSEIGRISGMLARVETVETPLLRTLGRFGRTLSVLILALAAATFTFGVLVRDFGADEMFLAAVGIAVAAIPEGLPAVITVILALGVRRMAERNAIVRRLPAVESLGSVDVICTDKTGTLTLNELTLRLLALPDGEVEASGSGYAPEGEVTRAGRRASIEADASLAAFVRAGILCNDATLHEAEDGWTVNGDPTDGAFLVLAEKAGLAVASVRAQWSRRDAIPFDSEHKFMAVLVHDHEGNALIAAKGAPEVILPRCAMTDEDREAWGVRLEALARRGFRLIAVAVRRADSEMVGLEFDDVRELDILGIACLIDAAREEAIAAVAECRRAGIAVTMITGDHAGTALAVAQEVGIDTAAGALTGADLDALDDAGFAEAAERVHVFARTAPAHKLRLVEALQARGHIVAMTGDGVNDAPALKRADIGVAMGKVGTEAAKEAAEMVLADDNFATIAAAVREGRTVYDNLKKTLLFILPTNGGQAASVIVAVLAGLAALPVTPVQILWVNLVVAVTLALALAFEPPEPDVMDRPPRRPDTPIFDAFLAWRIVLISALLAAATIGAFLFELADGASLETARGAAITALIAGQAAYLFNARSFRRSAFSRAGLFGNAAVWVTVVLIALLHWGFLFIPSSQVVFGVAPPDESGWLVAFAAAVAVFLVVEGEKALMRRFAPRDARSASVTPSDRRPPAAGSP
ncbi:cation-translocating P-type ATPase [Elioraea thermophila]|uniref:cation-translocating P-type ATPase n=1 Tax=Elioraea thermophila TaxID=2185104 RepID=UPI000DF2048E|nr:HAD-IC family P-type ATPase [Elioraea thermophila]